MVSPHESLQRQQPLPVSSLDLERPLPSQIARSLRDRVLTPPQSFPPYWLSLWQPHWISHLSDAVPPLETLLSLKRTHSRTVFCWRWTGLDGPVSISSEISVPHDDLQQHTSFSRISSKSPLPPGGLDSTVIDVLADINAHLDHDPRGIRTIPPGFDRGLDFDKPASSLLDLDVPNPSSIVPTYRPTIVSPQPESNNIHQPHRSPPALDSEVSELLPQTRLKSSVIRSEPELFRPAHSLAKKDWAHVVDVNREITNFHELVPNMAREYPFELDTFQKEAIYHLENGQSVFVAAHTSAGKTVVAEYAIALASGHMTRAIYTSPIKALSNQKFRDFKITFGQENVGILTGDVQINPDAGCLVMTTEILRNMLYKGADLIRDVEWVIFDEVHYVNDAERGVVWEEVIILLPEHVNIILLSATVPNAKEFADWVGRTKKKDIYVISTPKRPVPLEHFLYAGRDLFKIVDAQGKFLSQGHKDAHENLRRKQDKEREAAGLPPVQARGRGAAINRGGRGSNRGTASPNRGGGRGSSAPPARGLPSRPAYQPKVRNSALQDRGLWINLVNTLKQKKLLPVVIFVFSKKRCEEYPSTMTNTDLCTAKEKSEIHIVIKKSLARLKEEDRRLPQIQKISDLLSRGIGVHHGGLLPIVKEMVELLFARGIVKVLFATETFAMGVNMPARTVVFAHTRKHDGTSFRDLLPGEYTQMSGRAGRRGLDETGIVIILCADSEPPEALLLQQMILGIPGKLQSQFRLTYSMILNLLRVEGLKIEEMIKRSFSENATQKLLPEQQKQIALKEKELAALPKLDDSNASWSLLEYYGLVANMAHLNSQMVRHAIKLFRIPKGVQIGRVVILNDTHFRYTPAVILKGPFKFTGSSQEQYLFTVLAFGTQAELEADDVIAADDIVPHWPPPLKRCEERWTYELANVRDQSIALITDEEIEVKAKEIVEYRKKSAMQAALKEIVSLVKNWERSNVKFVELDPKDWIKTRDLTWKDLLKEYYRIAREIGKVCKHVNMADENSKTMYKTIHTRENLNKTISALQLSVSDLNLELLPDYEQRIEVLQRLEFIDKKSTVLLKGRVACEINTANELILTELILENTLSPYEPEEVVALLSCLVFQERSEGEPVLTPRLKDGKELVEEIAHKIETVQSECRANVKEESATTLHFGLMEVVYEWARGMPFEQVTNLTDVQEGTIVRTITRLDECCREVMDAARVIGDATLHQKMEACQLAIRRDVVFCASLYI